MRRVLLVEDEPQVASFIRTGLGEEGFVVDWVSTGAEGERRALGEPFDLVLLDIRLPDQSGLDVCRAIRRHNAALPILLLTALDAVEDRVAGLRAGADDYLPKPFAFDELLARIDALLRRAAVEPPERSHRDGGLRLDPGPREADFNGTPIPLTATEFDLLAYFLARRGQALTREVIYRDVWGHDFDHGTNLIDVYVGYLRRKLGEAGCPVQIDAVRGVGYRYVPLGKGPEGRP